MIGQRKASKSNITMAQWMLPSDANPAGNVHGGAIMKLVDNAAAVVAMRYSLGNVVTVYIDELRFLKPVYIGNLVILGASVVDASETSMEVEVKVQAENLKTGERWDVVTADLVFVAVDEKGEKKRAVPELVLDTEESKEKHEEAKKRDKLRIIKDWTLSKVIEKDSEGT